MLRAVAAGMACEMARVFGAVRDSGRVDSLTLGGGAANGTYFCNMLAALFEPLPAYVSSQGGLSGERGALHIFASKASRAPMRRMRAQPPERIESVRRHYERYLTVFERIHGDPDANGAVRLAPERKPAKEKQP